MGLKEKMMEIKAKNDRELKCQNEKLQRLHNNLVQDNRRQEK